MVVRLISGDRAILLARTATHRRRGAAFTLTELLVTIAVLSILAGILLVGLNGAMQSVNKTRTRALIKKINVLLMEKWASYEVRRVQLPDGKRERLVGERYRQETLDMLHRNAIAVLQRLEMPDRFGDIPDPSITNPSEALDSLGARTIIAELPALSRIYQRRLAEAVNRTTQHESAECLYLVVMYGFIDADGGRKRFRESEIGDVDGDGLKEFVDAWGRPIRFLRWAPGFSNDWSDVSECSDLIRVEEPTIHSMGDWQDVFRLYPLIYSDGPDGRPGIFHGEPPIRSNTPFWNLKYSEPLTDQSVREMLVGSPLIPDPDRKISGRDHEDNLHNHQASLR